MPFVKPVIVVMLLLIIASLAASMFSLVKDGNNSRRTVTFLTVRIALSIAVFLFMAFAFYMDWIRPHGIIPTHG
ncbi:MAG: twin transmembrane helix small protein [Gammaproteobacteria bacterium]|nr:twin transmembrane helix small protein [Gammaproteobacteria bacterium]